MTSSTEKLTTKEKSDLQASRFVTILAEADGEYHKSIGEFRQDMGVEEGKYKSNYNLGSFIRNLVSKFNESHECTVTADVNYKEDRVSLVVLDKEGNHLLSNFGVTIDIIYYGLFGKEKAHYVREDLSFNCVNETELSKFVAEKFEELKKEVTVFGTKTIRYKYQVVSRASLLV